MTNWRSCRRRISPSVRLRRLTLLLALIEAFIAVVTIAAVLLVLWGKP